MSIRVKCGEVYGIMNDDISVRELVDYIHKNCVKPETEYFHVLHNGECIAEFKKGTIYVLSDKQRVHDIPGFFRQDFYVKFASRFPKNAKKKKKWKKPEMAIEIKEDAVNTEEVNQEVPADEETVNA